MRKTILSCAAVALLAAAPSAHAQADRTGTVGPTSPTFAWDGGPGTSVGENLPLWGGASVGNLIGCFDGMADCEETLLKVEAAGKLTLNIDAADDSKDVLDMYVYATDESGEFSEGGPLGVPPGDEELGDGEGASASGDEKLELQVAPGHYVVQIKFFLADADTYKGTATLSGFPAPAAPAPVTTETPAPPPSTGEPAAPQSQQPAPPAQPQNADQPAAKKKKSKKAACQKKAKKIKNKAKRKKALKRCAKLKG